MQKFPRCIRLDASDPQVFTTAANPGEWAVPGTFLFLGMTETQLAGKQRQAFAYGWLGLTSFGFSSLVEVAEIDAAQSEEIVERLTHYFVDALGAPDHATARQVAHQEVTQVTELCQQPLGSLLAVERAFDDASRIRERFRLIRPERAKDHARIWEIEPEDSPGDDTRR